MNSKLPLVFLDIDGTLLDNNYQSNSNKLAPFILELQKTGFIFALNSNRALEDLLPVANSFSIEGSLIGENGSFIFDRKTKQVTKLLTQEQEETIKNSLTLVKDLIETFIKNELNSKNVFFIESDTVSELSDNPRTDYPEGSLIILNNKFRKYTLSIHIRKVKDKRYIMDTEALKVLLKFLRKNITSNDIIIDSSTTFNNILVYSSAVSKRTGIEFLKNNYPDRNILFIGDEENDYKMSKNTGNFYTLANANDKTKKLATYISPFPWAEGVYDILQHIVKDYD